MVAVEPVPESPVLPPQSTPSAATPPQRSGRARTRKGRVGTCIAVVWLTLVVVAAVLADVLPLQRYDAIIPGFGTRVKPHLGWPEPLGTDNIGRSTLSRLVYGARVSLIVGVGSVTLALAVGILTGTMAGYLRGKVDLVVVVVLDTILSLPALVLLLAVASIGRRDLVTLVASLSFVMMPTAARLARARALVLAEQEHIVAARVLGASRRRVLFRELVPEVAVTVSSWAFLMLAIVIVAEGSLSFLGLGVPPPSPSWGGMVNDGRPFLETSPHLVFVPASCLLLTVMSLALLGDRARARLDDRASALK